MVQTNIHIADLFSLYFYYVTMIFFLCILISVLMITVFGFGLSYGAYNLIAEEVHSNRRLRIGQRDDVFF